jgi:sec-independent protein translocase protein TatA
MSHELGLAFVGGIGPPELVIVLMLAVLLFGASKLPALGRSSGQALGEFKRGREQVAHELHASAAERSTTPPAETEPAERS